MQTPINAESRDYSIDDWLDSITDINTLEDSKNHRMLRYKTLLSLLDSSNGSAPFINRMAKDLIQSYLIRTKETPKDALRFKPYIRDLEIRIKRLCANKVQFSKDKNSIRIVELKDEAVKCFANGKTIVFVIVVNADGSLKDVLAKQSSINNSLVENMIKESIISACKPIAGMKQLKRPPVSLDGHCILAEFFWEQNKLELAMLPFGRVGSGLDPTRTIANKTQ